MNKKTSFLILLISLGMFSNFVLSSYIFAQDYLKENALFGDKCFTDPNSSCHAVQNSIYGFMFGIPVSLFGIIAFGLLGIFFYILLNYGRKIGVRRWISHNNEWLFGFVAIAMIGGSIFSLWLLYVQFYVLAVTCAYCLWVDSVMIGSTIIYLYILLSGKLTNYLR